MANYRGKSVVITGGASGIGFALAKAFGREGARVLIGEPDQARLDKAVKALVALGLDANAQVLDVTDQESFEAFADHAWSLFGGVDLFINNAGISLPPRRMMKISTEDLRRLFEVNFFGVWTGCQVFGRRMVAEGKTAAIYNTASENSFFNAAPGMAPYIASKHAVRGLTEAMREDMPDFITVGMICPGLVNSEMTTALGHLAMDTDDFAALVVEQIRAGEFYILTHAYNIERIKPVHDAIEGALAKYAPRYEGDEEYDVRLLIEKMREN